MRRAARTVLVTSIVLAGVALVAVYGPKITTATTPTAPSATAGPGTGAETTAVVTAVIDGDTITADIDGARERVRLIGVDTPEIHRDGTPNDCYADEARTKLDTLVWRKTVVLRSDPTQADWDQCGRLLRHLSVGGMDVVCVLIEGGYGREYTYRVAYDGQAENRAVERAARSAGRGLWGAC